MCYYSVDLAQMLDQCIREHILFKIFCHIAPTISDFTGLMLLDSLCTLYILINRIFKFTVVMLLVYVHPHNRTNYRLSRADNYLGIVILVTLQLYIF